MTERPRPSPAAEQPAAPVAEKPAAPVAESPASRPGPRPSPTSRARRNAPAAPEGLRRPSPRPAPAPATEPAGSLVQTDDGRPDTASTSTPSTSTHSDAGPPAGRRVPVWPIVVLAVVLLALAGLDGWLLSSQPASGSRAQRDQALSTAKTAVPLILSYDYRHFDADVSAAKARLTGRAVTDYAQAMTKTIEPTAGKVHAVVQAQTDGAGVEAVSGNGNQVTVVVFGEQKVTNTSLTAPRVDLFRVRVTLDRVRGQWLVSKFDQI